MKSKAIEAFLSLPRRGVEIGGLLFGNSHDGHPFVQRFEEVSCEHRYGPSFTLSDGDHVELTGKLARARREEALPVIGFCRSYTGRRAEVEAADRALIREHFREGDAVFLMLQPVDALTCKTSARLCRNGEFLDVPVMPAVPQPVAVEAGPEPILEAARPRDRSPRWWWLGVMCLIGAAAGTALPNLLTPAPQPRWVDLYLAAKPSADTRSLVITWDTAAPKLTGATHALLAVTDGQVHHDVPLRQSQLQVGSYIYTPVSGDLEFRLMLYGKGPALSSGILRVTPGPPAAEPAAQPAAPRPPAPPVRSMNRTAIREFQPSVPEGIRARMAEEVRIPVTVTIDAAGNVTRASAPRSDNGLHRYLAQLSERAARRWRFSGGSPSQQTIHFTFDRQK